MKLQKTLLFKFIRLITLCMMSVIIVFSIYFYFDQKRSESNKFKIYTDNFMERINLTLSDPLWNYETEIVEKLIQNEIKSTDIMCIIVYTNENQIFYGLIKIEDKVYQYTKDKIKALKVSHLLKKSVDIVKDDSKAGSATVYFTTKDQQDKMISMLLKIIIQNLVLLIIISIAIYIVFSNLILKNLNLVSSQMENIASGDGDLTKKIYIKTNDEMEELSFHFNNFIAKIDSIISKIKRVSFSTKEIGIDLANNTAKSNENLKSISHFMSVISDKINVLNDEIANSNGTLNSMKTNVNHLYDMLEKQSVSVSSSSSAIEEMIASIGVITQVTADKRTFSEELGILAKEGEQDMANTLLSINEIEKSAGVIFEMIKVINNVASQTNLLAMNAAIEAAHAGEYGKGFAVVADEIRNLAETTSTNSKNISLTLKTVIEKIKNTTNVTKKTNSSIGHIIHGIFDLGNSMNEMFISMQEITKGTSDISKSLAELVNVTNNINDFAKTMISGVNMIENSMKTVQTLSLEHNESMKEMDKGIKDIAVSLSIVSDLSNKNSNNIWEIDGQISTFKTLSSERP